MPFVLPENQTWQQFRQVLDEKFPNLAKSVANAGKTVDFGGQNVKLPALGVSKPADLIDDYARMGAFLSRRADVLAALETLEKAIGDRLAALTKADPNEATDTNLAALKQKHRDLESNINSFAGVTITTKGVKNRHQESILFKTHKLLSSCLKAKEDEFGFNNVGGDSTPLDGGAQLHSKAHGKVDTAGFRADDSNQFDLPKVDAIPSMPTGVPVLTNVVGGMDFQRILLRYGYHWKDPGAGGVAHGEYTHRLQWYALVVKWNALEIKNDPLEVFKSLGSLISRSNYPGPSNASPHTYLWETLFDCFPINTTEPDFRPRTTGFNCPDNLTADLTTPMNAAPSQTDKLFKLRVLMMARRYKRKMTEQSLDTPYDPAARFTTAGGKTATTVFQQREPQATGANGAFLVWYNSAT